MMRKGVLTIFMLVLLVGNSISSPRNADSVFVFAYSVNEGRSGLTLAWSVDKTNWHAIGPEHCFLFSDFGRWGAQKRMFSPYLFQEESGTWHCIWQLNSDAGQFAHTTSSNLYEWGRQSYPQVMASGNFMEPEVTQQGDHFLISWKSEGGEKEGYFSATTKDFKTYTATKSYPKNDRLSVRKEVLINGKKHKGQLKKVSWDLVDKLIKNYEWMQFHNSERAETLTDDPMQFANLKPLEAKITPKSDESKRISDMLIGIFFEDISYAADGGLYAELVQNRDFEYNLNEKENRDKTWTSKKAWTVSGNATFNIDTINPIHPNNRHFAVLDIKEKGVALTNEGWDGIPVEKDKKYDFSIFVKTAKGNKGSLKIRLVVDGKILGEGKINKIGSEWKKQSTIIKVVETASNATLEVVPEIIGTIQLDMISLFPQHTFKNRKNGLRADLAQTIADLNPTFIRFPGGCVAHGDGLDNIYRWENTIGPLESRVPQKNIWHYHQTAGLGYYEYFQYCEDLGAAPLPVVAAGVPCQNSATGGHGQQCGIPMEEMGDYVQSVLDLIEWANGDKNSKWGKKRAEAGHPEPFNLKYLGVGNEDLITDIFEERFTMIYDAIKEKYPEIVVIGTVGPTYRGTDYEQGWELAKKLEVPIVDEHYYQPPGWFINNQDFYDKYDRNGPKVYLGEYAAHTRGRRMNIETSLCEALYLTAVERNGDIVSMTSFAPLLAKEKHMSWTPDLIYFNNTEVKPTVDYYVQKLYGQNVGTQYIPSFVDLSAGDNKVEQRVGVSIVKDEDSGDLIIKLVNLLPVEVSSTIDLSDFQLKSEGVLTIMEGEPKDETVIPIEKNIQISDNLEYKIPAYSFTVIRAKSI
ncbi:alpha-L-arabinofuranosidase C-terminal domain-containing protein [Flammeovirgaceae bacterium SG7u.111]|nr:alpha-L-arabinofuranosidase C-terminal domain-containing protein [Flammeovirgaceae bacterium SG7u.132]WPO38432.1 alpha-L-arabinofuranosidase C-terminal domain-containing protein [Flammeovirgaceae bacterium SG7u.111]